MPATVASADWKIGCNWPMSSHEDVIHFTTEVKAHAIRLCENVEQIHALRASPEAVDTLRTMGTSAADNLLKLLDRAAAPPNAIAEVKAEACALPVLGTKTIGVSSAYTSKPHRCS